MKGLRFMCADCRLNEWAMKPGMNANEEEVHFLSVVQAGLNRKEMLSDDKRSA